MIKKLKPLNIYNVLNGISAITNIAELFSELPDDELIPESAYVYIIPGAPLTTSASDNQGVLFRQLVVTMNIVAAVEPATTTTDEIQNIIEVITNEIVSEGCPKISNWDGISVDTIDDLGESAPGYNIKNRAIVSKQYLFKYFVK